MPQEEFIIATCLLIDELISKPLPPNYAAVGSYRLE